MLCIPARGPGYHERATRGQGARRIRGVVNTDKNDYNAKLTYIEEFLNFFDSKGYCYLLKQRDSKQY